MHNLKQQQGPIMTALGLMPIQRDEIRKVLNRCSCSLSEVMQKNNQDLHVVSARRDIIMLLHKSLWSDNKIASYLQLDRSSVESAIVGAVVTNRLNREKTGRVV